MRLWPVLALGALLVGTTVAWAVTTKSGPAAAIEGTLARAGGDGIVLLGNSKVSTDLDLALLREALGPGAPTIAPANVYGTSAPVWYAVLKNRVYANGHRPKLLVVYAPLETTLTASLPAELARAVLGAQLGEDEPVAAAKVFGGELGPDVRERLRRLLLPACHPDRPRPQDAAGRPAPPPPAADVPPDRSFIGDIVALAKEHGTPTVFVRAPIGPSRSVQDDVPPERVAATVALLRAQGAGWIDLSRGAPEAAFGDGIHMNAAGRRQMTAMLAEALAPVLAGGALPIEAAAPASRLGVARDGTDPDALPLAVTRGAGCARTGSHPLLATLGADALRSAGFGSVSPLAPRQGKAALRVATAPPKPTDCTGMYTTSGGALQIAAYAAHGEAFELVPSGELPLRGPDGEEAWWVYPGTTLRVAVSPLAQGAPVEIVATAFGGSPSAGGGPAAKRASTAAAAAAIALDGGATWPARGATWRVGPQESPLGRMAAAGGETEIAVSSPADGPWLLVQRVRVDQIEVLGGDVPLHVDLLAFPSAYAAPPSPLPPIGVGKPSPDGAQLRFELPGVPDDEASFVQSGHGRCAPLEVLRDGAPVEDLDALPTSRGLLLTSRDCAPVGARAEGISWRLAPDRACRAHDGARWLYPGDILTLAAEVSGPLAGNTRKLRLDLGGGLVGPADPAATVAIDVRVDGARWASVTVPSSAFDGLPPSVELPPRRLREGARVEVRLTASPHTTWLVLTSVLLTEPTTAAPEGAWKAWASR
ncbi:MAG: hypothetical protein Q8P18_24215 [Pseudomonadota bacterium]|nr:hypothetical protein [Pseudomonadota bacterium]